MSKSAVRFNFGDNWQSYAAGMTPEKIAEAEAGLRRLLGRERLDGLRMVDIGCGSGVHALAALRMGARVTAIDIDPQSVATTRKMLETYAPPGAAWDVGLRSVLDTGTPDGAPFDIVYSWGVLHHTGRMWEAMDRAADMAAPGATIAVALYKKTPLCGFWRVEKAFYSRLPGWARPVLTAPYAAALLAAQILMGRNPLKYIKNYQSQRGMDFWHDVIDWLGGYPYESASPAEVADWAARRGLTPRLTANTAPARGLGILGTGCAEYVFTRPPL
jgi:2-polyprenyl-6-hydroxyphenyl methylase/3-demethylubiquinone-9 3-methyltransferase